MTKVSGDAEDIGDRSGVFGELGLGSELLNDDADRDVLEGSQHPDDLVATEPVPLSARTAMTNELGPQLTGKLSPRWL